MDYYSLSDQAIEEVLGQRIRSLRLRRNITQKELADASALSVNTIKSLEAGKGKLSSLIGVLRVLGALDQLDNFIPEPTISPMQLVKRKGRGRQRASGEHLKAGGESDVEW